MAGSARGGGRELGGWDMGRVRSWRFPIPDLFNFPSHSCPGSGGSSGSGSSSSPCSHRRPDHQSANRGDSGQPGPGPAAAAPLPKQTALRYLLEAAGQESSEQAASPRRRPAAAGRTAAPARHTATFTHWMATPLGHGEHPGRA
ncbi:hypothetical protein KIL84_012779 [Mauremys mutica]|uniref:Uncharacterized protein n=1 Tax=Mauremys mutica TaxID=74926 RepID=A0A9D3XT18_9SAUR|nr:hypothetical protein KIL84_012779 [Mauremys mutica]